MGNVLKKNFPSAKCQHCGKITDIQLSGDFRSLVSLNKTYVEQIKMEETKNRKIHRAKNAQIQTMHKVVKQLLDLMNEEQKKKAKKISQFMRDEIKKAEKEMLR